MKSQPIESRTSNLPAPRRETPAFAGRHARKHAVNRVRQRTRGGLRARVAAAFRSIANGCSPQTAFARTKDFYRSAGAAWTRHLG